MLIISQLLTTTKIYINKIYYGSEGRFYICIIKDLLAVWIWDLLDREVLLILLVSFLLVWVKKILQTYTYLILLLKTMGFLDRDILVIGREILQRDI